MGLILSIHWAGDLPTERLFAIGTLCTGSTPPAIITCPAQRRGQGLIKKKVTDKKVVTCILATKNDNYR